jgi:hypothetical protein
VSLRVTHRTSGGDAFLLSDEHDRSQIVLFYDRSAGAVSRVDNPGRLEGRASWRPFDGDPRPIVEEVQRLREADG